MSDFDDEISVIRHFSEDPFVRIPRATARDEALGWRALGMLTFMLSLPANWTFRLLHLSGRREGHGNGRHAVRAALGEMEVGGYLEIKRTRGSDGRINGVEWHISDRPIFTRTAPCSDFPTVENPTSENQALRKKESTKEKNEAAARPAQPAPQHAAAAHISKSDPTPTSSPRRRRGDELVRHGVEIWTRQDEKVVAELVEKYGEARVEEVAASLPRADGHRAPYGSVVVAAFDALAAGAIREARFAAAREKVEQSAPASRPEAARLKAKAARVALGMGGAA